MDGVPDVRKETFDVGEYRSLKPISEAHRRSGMRTNFRYNRFCRWYNIPVGPLHTIYSPTCPEVGAIIFIMEKYIIDWLRSEVVTPQMELQAE